ncbi:ABC transporter substrate-binding protein [Petrotoga sp. DB-2]
MRKLLVLLVITLSALAIFAQEAYNPEWLIADVEGGQKGGTLYLATTSGPKTLNIYWSQETSSEDIISWTLVTLLGSDFYGQPTQPSLAKDWGVEHTEDGGTLYWFEMREGVKWSDGHPLTVDDVVFTWEKIIVPDLTADGNDFYMDAEGNLPELTVEGNRIMFKYPTTFRFGLETLGGELFIMPKHVLEDKVTDAETFQSTWTVEQVDQIVVGGPFKVTEYTEGVRVVLERNPYYFEKSKDGVQLPYLDRVVYEIVTDTNVERLRFEAGEIDLYGPQAKDFPSLRAQAEEKGWNVIVGPATAGSNFVAFNFNAADPVHRAWFRNDNFRKAVAYAFDKQTIIDTLYNGLGVPNYGPRTNSSAFYNPEIEELGFRYSLVTAQRLLREAGFSWNESGELVDWDGNVVEFELNTNGENVVRNEIAVILVDSLAKLGIKVNYRPIQFNALVQRMYSPNWDAIIIGLVGGDDPGWSQNVWLLDGGLHFWNWSPEVMEWVDPNEYWVHPAEKRIDEIMRIQRSILDKDEIQELWDEWQMLIAENQILVYTISQNYLLLYKNTLHLYPVEKHGTINPYTGSLWNAQYTWKEQ